MHDIPAEPSRRGPLTETVVAKSSRLAGAILVIGSGVLLARVFVWLHPAQCCDAQSYFDLCQALIAQGPRALARSIRTYGYPAWLASISFWQPRAFEWVHAAAAVIQGALTGAAALIAYRWTRQLGWSRGFAAASAGALLINPVLLARASEMLTDLVSAVLLGAALYALIRGAWGEPSPLGAFASVFAASCAVAVRPSNVLLLAMFVLLWTFRAWRLRFRDRSRLLAALVLAAALPLLPQVALNWKFAGTANPFLMSSEYPRQAVWGMRFLKYATAPAAGQPPFLVYTNPFYDPAWRSPSEFLRHAPFGYAATLAIHGFALLDQDHLFTYVTDLRPWYRWPVSLANYAWLFVVAIGAACGIGNRGPCRTDRSVRKAAVLAVLLGAASLGFYLPTLIESRFATPIYLLGVPLFATGLRVVIERPKTGAPRRSLKIACAGLAFMLACAGLSAWIETRSMRNPGPPQVMAATAVVP